ncbi:MAG: Na+/H+ antiporter NhaC family protein [Muribaculaceae bacterium]|nr:Na+/H+ antiporter NhaC family protein [Muribaculaceae bacterium]
MSNFADVKATIPDISAFHQEISHRQGLLALSPIFVFLLLYLVVSMVIGDFYKMPISVAFIAASVWAVIIDYKKPLSERIETFSRAAGSSNIIYMIWIFILAGAFASLAKEIGAIDATVNATLKFLPHELILPGMFLAACFISLSIGTSVGTVVALVPLAVDLAGCSGGNVALFVAAVLGGAFFGDNLSFISDTTIAATRTQSVAMNVKFKANFIIVLPAAIVALVIYTVLGYSGEVDAVIGEVNVLLLLPYVLVIILALVGLNVTVVLVSGIVSAIIIAVATEGYSLLDLAGFLGSGIDSMGDLIIITLVSAGMLGIIKATGGIDYMLQQMTRRIHGVRGAKLSIAALVSAVNVCTANNTVAILTVGSLSQKIAKHYGISGARTASLLDTCSCIMQCLLPYGAQTLLAVGLAGLSPGDPWPYLYYPWALAAAVMVSIIFGERKTP